MESKLKCLHTRLRQKTPTEDDRGPTIVNAAYTGQIKVRFADTDANGHTYFGSYLVLADEVVSEYLAQVGWDGGTDGDFLTFTVNANIDFVGECMDRLRARRPRRAFVRERVLPATRAVERAGASARRGLGQRFGAGVYERVHEVRPHQLESAQRGATLGQGPQRREQGFRLCERVREEYLR